MNETRTINISTLTFVKIIGFGLLLLFLFLVKTILAMIFLAFIFASAIKPVVNWLRKGRIPKILSIVIVYLVFISILLTFMVLIIPPVSHEIGQLAKSFPIYYQQLNSIMNNYSHSTNPAFANQVQQGLDSLSNGLAGTITAIFNTTYQIFSGFFTFVLILVIAFYFASEENAIKNFAKDLIPEQKRSSVVDLFTKIQEKLGYWFRAYLVSCFTVFCTTFIGLFIGGIKYALVLALIAGIFEIIPFFGSWGAAILTVLLAFSQSPTKAFIAIIVIIIVQQFQQAVVTPHVLGKSLGLNPLLVIIGILIGFQLGGIMGALIAVPFIAALSVLVEDGLKRANIGNRK